MNMTAGTNWPLYRWVLHEAWPYRFHIGSMLILNLLSIPLELLTPLGLKIAVDSVVGDEPMPGFLQAVLPVTLTSSKGTTLVMAAGLFVAVALITQLRSLANGVLGTYTGEKLVLNFRARLLRHAQRLSLSYHDKRGTADSIYRIQYDAPAVRWIAVDSAVPLVTSILTLIAMIYVTARVDLQLALVALVVSPVLFAVLRVYGRHLRRRWHGAKRLESSLLSTVQETLSGVRVVKAFGQEEREEERFVHRAGENVGAQIRLALLEGGLGLMVGATLAVGTAAVLFIGVRHVLVGTLTLGNLLLVMGYLVQLYRPMEDMSKKMTDLQASLASVERTLDLLGQDPEVPEKPHAQGIRRAKGAVAFENVSFAYEEAPILQDVSFKVDPGARVGITGTTGAGKTTLVSLITRFYDPTEGLVKLDGVDLRDFKLADLRNQFAIVLQEPVLFSNSIAENIAYARPNASYEEIVAAANSAGAHEFIERLPEGYDTQVGERGMRLSGGERQRISLARAFLKDAPILLLDEPTSSIDIKTEASIMEAMERLMRGRTTFMIAHRMATLANCNMRLEIEDGRVVNLEQQGVPIAGVGENVGESLHRSKKIS